MEAFESDVVSLDGPHPCSQGKRVWYVAYTKPRAESIALLNLEQQGFDAYLPLYKQFKKTPTGMAIAFEPMFPRYIFFRPAHVGQSIAPVQSTRGVTSVIRFGAEPGTLSVEAIHLIQQIEATRKSVTADALYGLRPGLTVKIDHPAFKGLEGIVKAVSSKRVTVLLEWMGREQLVQVQNRQLLAA